MDNKELSNSLRDALNTSDVPPGDPLLGDWSLLQSKVKELLALTETLARENHALRTQQRNWSTERAKLIEKNELAKSRVESMITRLKALEQDA